MNLLEKLLELNSILLAKGFVTRQVPDLELDFSKGLTQISFKEAITEKILEKKYGALFLTKEVTLSNMDVLWASFREAYRTPTPWTRQTFEIEIMK